MNCIYATVSESNITAYVNNSSPFPIQLIKSNFPSVLIVCHQFFIWIALCDVDLCFSLIIVRKASAVEKETR